MKKIEINKMIQTAKCELDKARETNSCPAASSHALTAIGYLLLAYISNSNVSEKIKQNL